MRVVLIGGKRFDVDMRSTDTIGALRARIHAIEEVDPELQYLRANGHDLTDDNQTLEEAGIKNTSHVCLVKRAER